jgi:hypothetical protein
MRLVTGCLCTIAASAALSATAFAQAGDSVTGSGTFAGGPALLIIDAHSGPAGEKATGTLGVIVTQTNFDAFHVFCLSVTGSRAVIGVTDLAGQRAFVFVKDNATPGAGADTIGGSPFGQTGTCAQPTPATSVDVLTEGDFQVVDAQPSPTSKDQCTNGGWRRYGGFKNQGDCVSFVATGGRKQPAVGQP